MSGMNLLRDDFCCLRAEECPEFTFDRVRAIEHRPMSERGLQRGYSRSRGQAKQPGNGSQMMVGGHLNPIVFDRACENSG